MKHRYRIVALLSFVFLLCLAGGLLVAVRSDDTFTLQPCEGNDCIVYLEDTVNKCSWKNGKIEGTTLIGVPVESLKEVRIGPSQVQAYLDDAASAGKCTTPK